jgi:hypothetical protein
MHKLFTVSCGLALFLSVLCQVNAQSRQTTVAVIPDTSKHKVTITVNGKPFTSFVYTDTLEKPVLYPIYAGNGEAITRGFPWQPQPNDPTDHPHHIGLWFNYERVNGLDFWNNSYAIAADKKKNYGWIKTTGILTAESGEQGKLVYTANWVNQQQVVLLNEKTTYFFGQENNERIIDRVTELKAEQDVAFPDAKDGVLGLRVAHELELPITQTKEYKDAQGNITRVMAAKDATVTGNYLTSAGKEGDAAWGTRGEWCMLYGRKGNDTISIAIIDHPKNPGYPTYWHARNYGLFAANPLGQKVFSEGKENLNFHLKKGQTVVFRYRVVIATGKTRLDRKTIEQLRRSFTE